MAMVTGTSRGIGRGTAFALAGSGYDVAVTARTVIEGTGPDGLPGSLETTAAGIEASGADALPIPLDLLDRDALTRAIDTVLDQWGRLDALVNNAVYVGPENDKAFVDIAAIELERRLHADLTAQLLLAAPRGACTGRRGSSPTSSAAEASAATTSSPVWWRPNGFEPHPPWPTWPSRGRCRPW